MRKLLALVLWLMVGLVSWLIVIIAPHRYCEARSNDLFRSQYAIYAPDGRSVLVISRIGTAERWGINSDRPIQTYFLCCPMDIRSMPPLIGSVTFAPDGKTIVASWDEGSNGLIDTATGDCLFCPRGQAVWVAFAPDGKTVMLGNTDGVIQRNQGSLDGTVTLWDLATKTPLYTFQGHDDTVTSIAFAPDGKRALTGSLDHTAKVWDVATGRLLYTFQGHNRSGVVRVAYALQGKRVLIGSDDNTVELWDAMTGTLLLTLQGNRDFVFTSTLSPDGKFLLTLDNVGLGQLWDVDTGKLLHTLQGYTYGQSGFSPNGKTILTSNGDGVSKLWDIATGRLLHTLQGDTSVPSTVAFSPDSKSVLIASNNGSAKLWDVESDTPLFSLQGQKDVSTTVAYAPNGKTILTNPFRDRPVLWDAATGRMLHPFCPTLLRSRWRRAAVAVAALHAVLPLLLIWRATRTNRWTHSARPALAADV